MPQGSVCGKLRERQGRTGGEGGVLALHHLMSSRQKPGQGLGMEQGSQDGEEVSVCF